MPAADLIIINHSAARARRLWPIVKKQLDAARVEYQADETKAAGDATIKTREALRSGVESVVVVGGDGTLSETAEGFFEFAEFGLKIIERRGEAGSFVIAGDKHTKAGGAGGGRLGRMRSG